MDSDSECMARILTDNPFLHKNSLGQPGGGRGCTIPIDTCIRSKECEVAGNVCICAYVCEYIFLPVCMCVSRQGCCLSVSLCQVRES